ncbi:hypothetical protein [Deinococcus alpinitundrae]|nr:hypothetical protein [Deinococcus alpinitundrae]
MSSAEQYFVSVNGVGKYVFDLEDQGVDSREKAIALAKKLKG